MSDERASVQTVGGATPQPNPGYDLRTAGRVESYAEVGLSVRQIAALIGLLPPQVQALYARELLVGEANGASAVAQRVYAEAVNPNAPASTAIFWLKARSGWAETQRHEHVVSLEDLVEPDAGDAPAEGG